MFIQEPFRRRLVGAALTLALVIACPELASAATPDDLCRSLKVEIAISDAKLTAAVVSAEPMLNTPTSQGADQALAQLNVTSDGGTPSSDADRARYCVTAGTAMRTASTGSPLIAQTYLLTAFRLAEASNTNQVAAAAAYQLGLIAPTGNSSSGGVRGVQRGHSRSASTAAPEPRQLPVVLVSGEQPCRQLSAPSTDTASSSFVMVTAFQCAAFRAAGVADYQKAAVSLLKLARYALSVAETSSERETFEAFAQKWAAQGLTISDRISDGFARVELSGRLLEALASATGGNVDSGITARLNAIAMQPQRDAGARAAAAGLTARLALLRGDKAGASAAAQRAMFFESQRPLASRMADWLLVLADAEPGRRAQHVTQAYGALETVRPFLPLKDSLTDETNFSLRMKPVFEQAVETQFAASDAESGRIAATQRIIETYRQAEVQSLLGDICLPTRPPLEPSELRADELIIYPIVLAHRVELLFASGVPDETGIRRYRRVASIAIERSTVADLVTKMVQNTTLTNPSPAEDVRADAARKLYDLFIAPIADRISPSTILVVIPDRMLRSVPFASLINRHGKFLIEDTRMAIAPALAYSQPGVDHSGPGSKVVAAFLQRDMGTPFGRFPKLDGVASEARAVVEASGRRGTLLQNFGKEDLVRALAEQHLDVLHLATHASFNGGAERSFIVTGSGMLTLPELRQILIRNRQRGAELDLLVLSACETAVGDEQASMGLAGAAVQAGAQSALASLWQVSDLGTSELMKAFYSRFRAGASKADALRDAQIRLINEGGDNADPGVWAAFVLLGGWR